MPWSEQTAMSQRQAFVEDALRGLYSMTALCARYSIRRRVGYKWLDRFLRDGPAGLADRSRRPQHCPRALAPALVELLLTTRRAHPTWGPRKILAYLARRPRHPVWSAASTVGTLFSAHGLVRARRRHRPQSTRGQEEKLVRLARPPAHPDPPLAPCTCSHPADSAVRHADAVPDLELRHHATLVEEEASLPLSNVWQISCRQSCSRPHKSTLPLLGH